MILATRITRKELATDPAITKEGKNRSKMSDQAVVESKMCESGSMIAKWIMPRQWREELRSQFVRLITLYYVRLVD